MITIEAQPFTLTPTQRKSASWRMKEKIAMQNLAVIKSSMQRSLEYGMSVTFFEDILIRIKVSKADLETIIDYSSIKDKFTVKLIKLYFSNDKVAFANEWLKLCR